MWKNVDRNTGSRKPSRGRRGDSFSVTARQTVTLDRNVWEFKAGTGSCTLSLHIPLGGAMALHQCIDSMKDAYTFFEKHFPDQPVVGIDCYSWTFGNQLEEMLEPDANLVKYLREGYLFPCRSPREEGLHFIFYRFDGDIPSYPRDTDLQGKIIDWFAAGRDWRGSGWFILREDADHYGEQHYRSQWPPRSLDLQDA